jgi:hypothetical protein
VCVRVCVCDGMAGAELISEVEGSLKGTSVHSRSHPSEVSIAVVVGFAE